MALAPPPPRHRPADGAGARATASALGSAADARAVRAGVPGQPGGGAGACGRWNVDRHDANGRGDGQPQWLACVSIAGFLQAAQGLAIV
jgi:hypothetical protein